MRRGIVYTRHDGGVTVCWPSANAIRWLANGGRWPGRPKEWLDEQVDRHIAAGHHEWTVRRYVQAMQNGGCTTAEALEIIRDRDCAHLGTGFELWYAEELPDRWFRDAWRRSHNGGHIEINMIAARNIQLRRICAAIDSEDKRSRSWLSTSKPVHIDRSHILSQINKARSPTELMRVWPSELAQ